MKFTKLLWTSTEDIFQKIIEHPFNVKLATGKLDLVKFKYYLQQDELYIKDYSRALSLLAAKAPSIKIMNILLGFAKEGYQIEHELHEYFFQKFHIKSAKKQNPACLSYSSFLLSKTALDSYEEGLAAILPCFWLYREVGLHIFQNSKKNNPYQAWIETYSGEIFQKEVEDMLDLTERAAAVSSEKTLAKMRENFQYSANLEFRFWDAAYRLEKQ